MAIESGAIVLVAATLLVVILINWILSGRMRIALELLVIFGIAEFLTIYTVSALNPDKNEEFLIAVSFPAVLIFIFTLRFNQLIKDPYRQFKRTLEKQTMDRTFTVIDEGYVKKHPGEISGLIKSFNLNSKQISELLIVLRKNEGVIHNQTKEINMITEASNRTMVSSVDDVDNILQSIVILDDSIQQILNEMKESIIEIGLKFNDINATLQNSDRLTDQTNLIAVNAAIEAVHSGEAGENFNIVADSIQRLSSRTRESTDKLIRETNLTRNLTESRLNSVQIQVEQLEEIIIKIAELANNSSSFAHHQQDTSSKLSNLTKNITSKSSEIQDEINKFAT